MNGKQPQPVTDPIMLPPRMRAALTQYQKRVWIIKLTEGALAALFGLVMSYLLVFVLDRLFDTPATLRAVILAAGSIGMVILFPLKYHNWVWRHRRLDQAARLVRHTFPRFGDHLLGIVELAQSDSQLGKSRALVAAAMRQVDAELAQRDLTDAVPNAQHRRWAWVAGVPLAGAVLMMVLIPAAGGNALKRWLTPWRATERYTFAQLSGQTDLHVVPYAEPFQVIAQLKADSPWKPAFARARYEKQSPINVARDGTRYRFAMPPQTTDGKVSLRVGDARQSIVVEPKLRPALNALWAQVQLPTYLQRNDPIMEDARGGTVSLVKGSNAFFLAMATRDLANATLNGRAQSVDGPQVTTEPIAVELSAEYRLTWRDRFGLSAREAQVLRIEALDDQGPTVNVSNLKNQQVLLSHEVLSFEIQASDDFGVKRIGLAWQGITDPIHNPEPSRGQKIVAAGAPTNETMDVSATFCADREGVRAQSLRLRAFAEDYLPNRQRVYSPPLVLHVLNSAEHFKWLTDQMSQWAGAAKEVYDKELQLHEINKELRDLPFESLDDPAQRKTIRQQATAELANATQLNALIDTGKALVREAAKNEEFDADQLDGWAEMLKQLEAIAGEQMPSVADLLQQAAEAQGQPMPPTTESPLSDEPGDAKPKKGPNDKDPEAPLAAPPGADDLGQAADKYGPKVLNPEGFKESPNDPNPEAADAMQDKSEPPEGEPGTIPANPTPLVGDIESGFNKSEKAGEAPQIKGGLLIPGTMLKGSGKPEEKDGEEPEDTTAELIIQAVSEQQTLLDAFAKLAEEMNTLLMGFENSTFVKRFKAASRKQIDLAVELNSLDGFGVDDPVPDTQTQRQRLAERETAASDRVLLIQEDMDAYAERKPSKNYTRVLTEMQEATVVMQIRDLAVAINRNEVGQSTIEAEYWADTLDRWAEQLVDPLGESGPPSEGLIELPSLTPELILEVLRIINGEIELREETRELDQAIGAIEQETYERRGDGLSTTQAELACKSRELAEQIRVMPNAPDHADATLAWEIEALTDKGELQGEALAKRIEWLTGRTELGKEVLQEQIDKLTKAATVMDEVEALLARPATGPPTIAAILEVLEILLETHRLPNTPMIVKAPPATTSALMLMGLGDDSSKAFIEDRAPGQATGKTGRTLPEEFRMGLDVYFDALEGKKIE
jgi:hypothetical protein